MGKPLTAAIAAYALIGIVTFGHATAALQEYSAKDRVECKADPERNYCPKDNVFPVFVGLFVGAAWPLYWSWEVFSDD